VWTLATAILLAFQAVSPPVLTQGLSPDGPGPQFLLECGTPGTRGVEDFGIVMRLDGRELPRTDGIVGGVVGGTVGGALTAGTASARIQLLLMQAIGPAPLRAGRFGTQLLEGRLVPLEPGRHRLAVRCLGAWSNELSFEWDASSEPSVPQPTLMTAVVTAARSPSFVLDCVNVHPRRIPETELLSNIALRLDGQELPPPSGGIVGSTISTPGVDPAIPLRGSVRLHLRLVQPDSDANVRSGGFGARFTLGRAVPLTAGTHRLAVQCLGQWSNEVTFAWEP